MLLVTYNIQFSCGLDGRCDLARIARTVDGADVIALQEVERFWRRSGDVDQPARLAELLPEYDWVYGPGVDLAPEDGRGPQARRQFGNMLLARTRLLSSRNHLLPKYASTGGLSLQRSALEAVLDTPFGLLRVYSVHLTHLSAATRRPQVERLLAIHERAPVEGAAVAAGSPSEEWADRALPPEMPRDAVLLGDFNMEPDSAEYELVVGPMSDYDGRIGNPEGFVDAWVHAGGDESDGVTGDVRGRPARLDYCFVSTRLSGALRSVRVDRAADGSDHFPLWIELSP